VRISLFIGAAAMAVAAPAVADWVKAESKHFIIYGDMPLEEMRSYAERLEKFDAAARVVRSMKDPDVGDGNRVQVFVVPTMLDVNRTLGSADAGVGGYYVGTVTGPYIVTPRKSRQINDYRKLEPETVFFHEYTHHLMLQNTNKPMPAWLTEGFAEFLANPIFNEDGSVGLGTPATHRAAAILKARWAPMADLLGGNAITLGYSGFWNQNYAQGWLLNHYLAFEPSRKGQIDAYVKRISAGEEALPAARAVFGDLNKLEDELRAYSRTEKFPYLKIDATKLTVPPVTVAPLPPGSAEAMMLRIYAKTGYGALGKGQVLKRVRDIARRYPGEALVQRTLAEVEYDNENWAEAEQAADAALKLEPKSVEAMLFKGRALLGKAKKDRSAEGFKAARTWFARANRTDKEDPEPLYLYYRSFRDANEAAPASAVEALNYAAVLAPRDLMLQVRLTAEYLRQNKLAEAKAAIEPIAFLPHAGQNQRNEAYKALKLIEGGKGAEALALIEKDILPKSKDDPA
jgi:hypothetical protein